MTQPPSPSSATPSSAAPGLAGQSSPTLVASVADPPAPNPPTSPGSAQPRRPRRRWLSWLATGMAIVTFSAAAFVWGIAPWLLKTALIKLLSGNGAARVEIDDVRYEFPLGVAVSHLRVWAPAADDRPPVLTLVQARAALGAIPLPGRPIVIKRAALTPELYISETPDGQNTLSVWIAAVRAALASETPDAQQRSRKVLAEVLRIDDFVITDGVIGYVALGEDQSAALALRDLNLSLDNQSSDGRVYAISLDGDIGPFGRLALRSRLDAVEGLFEILPDSQTRLALTDDRFARLPPKVQGLLAAFNPRGELFVHQLHMSVPLDGRPLGPYGLELLLTEASVSLPGANLSVRDGRCQARVDDRSGLTVTLNGTTNHGPVEVTASLGALRSPQAIAWQARLAHQTAGTFEARGLLPRLPTQPELPNSTPAAADAATPAADDILMVSDLRLDTDLAQPVFTSLLPVDADGHCLLRGLTGRLTLAGHADVRLPDGQPLKAQLALTGQQLAGQIPTMGLRLDGGRFECKLALAAPEEPIDLSLQCDAQHLTLPADSANEPFAPPLRDSRLTAQTQWHWRRQPFPTRVAATVATHVAEQPLALSAQAEYLADTATAQWSVVLDVADQPLARARGRYEFHPALLVFDPLRITYQQASTWNALTAMLPPAIHRHVAPLALAGQVEIAGPLTLNLATNPPRLVSADVSFSAVDLTANLTHLIAPNGPPDNRWTLGHATVMAQLHPDRFTLRQVSIRQAGLVASASAQLDLPPDLSTLLENPLRLRQLAAQLDHAPQPVEGSPQPSSTNLARLDANVDFASGMSTLAATDLRVSVNLTTIAQLLAKAPPELDGILPPAVIAFVGDLRPQGQITLAGPASLDLRTTKPTFDGLTLTASQLAADLEHLIPGLGPLGDGQIRGQLDARGLDLTQLSATLGQATASLAGRIDYDLAGDAATQPVKFSRGDFTLRRHDTAPQQPPSAPTLTVSDLAAVFTPPGVANPSPRLALTLGGLSADLPATLALVPANVLDTNTRQILAALQAAKLDGQGAVTLNLSPLAICDLNARAGLQQVSVAARPTLTIRNASAQLAANLRPDGVVVAHVHQAAANLATGLIDDLPEIALAGLSARAEFANLALVAPTVVSPWGRPPSLAAWLDIPQSPLGPISAVLSQPLASSPLDLTANLSVTINEALLAALPPKVRTALVEAQATGQIPLRIEGRFPLADSASPTQHPRLAATIGKARLASPMGGLGFRDLTAVIVADLASRRISLSQLSAEVSDLSDKPAGSVAHDPAPGWLSGQFEITLTETPRVTGQLDYGHLPVPGRFLRGVDQLHSARLDGSLSVAAPLDALSAPWQPADALTLRNARFMIQHGPQPGELPPQTLVIDGLSLTLAAAALVPSSTPTQGPPALRVREGRIDSILGGSLTFDAQLDLPRGLYAVRLHQATMNLTPAEVATLPIIGSQIANSLRPTGAIRLAASASYTANPIAGQPALTWTLDRAEFDDLTLTLATPDYTAKRIRGTVSGDHRQLTSRLISLDFAGGLVELENLSVTLPDATTNTLVSFAGAISGRDIQLQEILDAGRSPDTPPTAARGRIGFRANARGDQRGLDGLDLDGLAVRVRDGRFFGIPLFDKVGSLLRRSLSTTPFSGALTQTVELDGHVRGGALTITRLIASDPLVSLEAQRGLISSTVTPARPLSNPSASSTPAPQRVWSVRMDLAATVLNQPFKVVGGLVGLGLQLGGTKATKAGEAVGELIDTVLPITVRGSLDAPNVQLGAPQRRADWQTSQAQPLTP